MVRRYYDTLGRLLRTEDPNSGSSEAQYDLVGNLTLSRSANSIADTSCAGGANCQDVLYEYDALDRLMKIDRPGLETDYFVTHDPVTRRRQTITLPGIGTGASHLAYEYDELGRARR